MTIKDSGTRCEFPSGSVRDIQAGKGRCDLLPLQVISNILDSLTGGDYVLNEIDNFVKTGKTAALYRALSAFAIFAFDGSAETMILEVSKHFEDGAIKYGENNWQKGLPVSCYINSAVRHYLKHHRGDKDEPHDRAFVWNIVCCIWEVDYHHEN